MYPDLKFMNLQHDDIVFAPLSTNNSISNGLFMPEEFIEEFRVSSISENPLKIDFREALLNADIENKDEELRDLINNYEEDPENILPCYNNFYRNDVLDDFSNLPLDCEILRELDLDIDEETLELERDFESSYSLDYRHNSKCNPEVIFNHIKEHNPRILYAMHTYKIPYPIAKRFIKQIIKLTLNCNKGGN